VSSFSSSVGGGGGGGGLLVDEKDDSRTMERLGVNGARRDGSGEVGREEGREPDRRAFFRFSLGGGGGWRFLII